MKIELSIIYVYYNTPREIIDSISSIKKFIGTLPYEIIIVNNNSPLSLPSQIMKNGKIKVINNKKNEGFGKGMNIGFKHSKGKFVVLSNPDVVFMKNTISEMLSVIKKDSKIGVIGPKYIDSKGKRLRSVSSFPFLPKAIFAFSILNKILPNNTFSRNYWLNDLNLNKDQEVDVIGGACMMIRSETFKKVKGFDENFFLYFEESDICLRIKKLGYKIVYHPKSQIVHLVGRSLSDKDKIEKYFESSRLYFFKKYHGFLGAYLGEMTIRFLKSKSLLVFVILLISTFLNLYRIRDLMLFFGDAARDYLVAKDMIISGTIPLVGIPSSVVWLHQGPLSIYLIGLSFILSNFNPIAPAILYAILGVLGTYLVYKLGSLYFNSSVGLISALFYATSPLVVINARMPYHTSPIPVLASLFFILLHCLVSGNKKLLFLTFFIYGLLLQVELSNSVLLLIIFIIYVINRKKVLSRDIFVSVLGFLFGVLPFILYDLKNHFVYSIGFPLWTLNRVRLFFGIAANKKGTIYHLPLGLETIVQQMSAIIFPSLIIVFTLLMVFVVDQILLNRKIFLEEQIIKNKKNIILLWVIIPLLAYFIHTTPGTAYFPLLFPAISLLVGFSFYKAIITNKLFIPIFIFLCIFNSCTIVANSYFVTVGNKANPLPPFSYNLGSSWELSDRIVRAIILDSYNRPFNIKGGDFFGKTPTGVDTYKFLAWWRGAKLDKDAKITYLIFDKTERIPKFKKIYEDNFTIVLKYDN